MSKPDLSKCCRWCEREFGSHDTRTRHEKEMHKEEFVASRLKHSNPDNEKFYKCIDCNCWSLNNVRSIEMHGQSALHKSLRRSTKKRKQDSSSSQLPLRGFDLSERPAPKKKAAIPVEAASSAANTFAFGMWLFKFPFIEFKKYNLRGFFLIYSRFRTRTSLSR